jgi:hypothetical protein
MITSIRLISIKNLNMIIAIKITKRITTNNRITITTIRLILRTLINKIMILTIMRILISKTKVIINSIMITIMTNNTTIISSHSTKSSQ